MEGPSVDVVPEDPEAEESGMRRDVRNVTVMLYLTLAGGVALGFILGKAW